MNNYACTLYTYMYMYFVTTLVSINGLRLYLIMHNYKLATPTKCFDKNLKKNQQNFILYMHHKLLKSWREH